MVQIKSKWQTLSIIQKSKADDWIELNWDWIEKKDRLKFQNQSWQAYINESR